MLALRATFVVDGFGIGSCYLIIYFGDRAMMWHAQCAYAGLPDWLM